MRLAHHAFEHARERDAGGERQRGSRPALAAGNRAGDRSRVAIDRALEVVPALVAGRDDRVHEERQRVLDDRDQQVATIPEMHVKSAAGVAGAGTDRVQAGGVETVLGELGERRGDQRLTCFLLRFCPSTSLICHCFPFLTYAAVCGKSAHTYEHVCESPPVVRSRQ